VALTGIARAAKFSRSEPTNSLRRSVRLMAGLSYGVVGVSQTDRFPLDRWCYSVTRCVGL